MPADNRSVVITLKLEDEDSGSSNPTDTSSSKSKNDKNGKAKAIAAFAVAQTSELVAREAISWGEYYWNKELTLNDDYIGQRNKNIAISQINAGVSALSTVGSMTATGAMVGGWVGAIVGAVVGTVTAAAGIIRSNVQGREQQDIQIRQMNAQLDFTRSRAGWSLNAGSIGEDL